MQSRSGDHSVLLGSLDLLGDNTLPFWLDVMTEGTDLGSPQPIEVALQSLLQDVSLVLTQGYTNRTITLRVGIAGFNAGGLALGEAALFAEVGKANVLKWTPPDGWGATTVFEVVTSSMDPIYDFDSEQFEKVRYYSLTLQCAAFGRSVDEVMVEAAAAPSTPPVITMVDDGLSAAAWSSTAGTVVDSDNSILLQRNNAKMNIRMTKNIPLTATPYVDFEWASSTTKLLQVYAIVGTQLVPMSIVAAGAGTDDYVRFVVRYNGTAPASIDGLYIYVESIRDTNNAIRFRNVRRLDRVITSSPFQTLRTLDISGSARTQARLEVSSETSGLGALLLFSWRDDGSGYTPAMRPFAGTNTLTTTDATLVSGSRTSLVASGDQTIRFDIPATQTPQGNYQLYARLRANATGNHRINWTAQMMQGGVAVGDPVTGSALMRTGIANTWRYVPLGELTMPLLKVGPSSNALIRITINKDAAVTAVVDIDEAFRFWQGSPRDAGGRSALTWVECGSGTPTTAGPYNRVWISPATSADDVPSILRGFAADASDAMYPDDTLIQAWDPRDFAPPRMNLYVVAPGATDVRIRAFYFPRWHTHAVT